jgi:hypothetical protein
MNGLVIILLTSLELVSVAQPQKPIVSDNGNAFAIVRTKDQTNKLVYELQRTASNGAKTTLWRSTAQAPGLGLMSDITTIFEDQGQISLLLLQDEASVVVFQFPSTASSIMPIYLHSLLRGSDDASKLRFKHHGELICESPQSSSENVISFDTQGNITDDFRTAKAAPGTVTLVSSGGSSPVTPLARTVNPPLPVVPAPGPNKAFEAKPMARPPRDELNSSTPWSIIVLVIVSVSGMFWLVVKRHS